MCSSSSKQILTLMSFLQRQQCGHQCSLKDVMLSKEPIAETMHSSIARYHLPDVTQKVPEEHSIQYEAPVSVSRSFQLRLWHAQISSNQVRVSTLQRDSASMLTLCAGEDMVLPTRQVRIGPCRACFTIGGTYHGSTILWSKKLSLPKSQIICRGQIFLRYKLKFLLLHGRTYARHHVAKCT